MATTTSGGGNKRKFWSTTSASDEEQIVAAVAEQWRRILERAALVSAGEMELAERSHDADGLLTLLASTIRAT